jgi:hypothetical protein
MSERKVLSKYIPPDFDPAALKRTKGGPKSDKLPTVRLMTPFSMQCRKCGTFVPKSKKFNARKQTPVGENYLGIQIYRFFFRCPGCSGELVFSTDPKNNDYRAEGSTKRNFEPWREGKVEQTDEEILASMEAEGQEEDVDVMLDLESKMADAQAEMAVADALDEIRANNARHEIVGKEVEVAPVKDVMAEIRLREDEEDEAAAKAAFQRLKDNTEPVEVVVTVKESVVVDTPVVEAAPTFKKVVKKKKDFGAALGIKRKT